MKDIQIPTRQAIQRLSDTNLIRVLKEGEVPGLVVRFVPREEIIKALSENVVEVTGPEAMKKTFGMSYMDDAGDVTFVQTNDL